MGFYMRWGNSCGIPFKVKEYCNEHRQWSHLEPYLKDRPTQPWTYFTTTDNYNKTAKKTRSLKPVKVGGKKTRRLA
jgi:hypothetical protein